MDTYLLAVGTCCSLAEVRFIPRLCLRSLHGQARYFIAAITLFIYFAICGLITRNVEHFFISQKLSLFAPVQEEHCYSFSTQAKSHWLQFYFSARINRKKPLLSLISVCFDYSYFCLYSVQKKSG